ncbi:MFS general substrate transporter [Phanerochaete sordida]|uniref:MFS general substrate transporter n=1 Tax=Phanerochaete sordida TaxID=48140 RepID=A0A9P3G9E8_9APHY|nr:MFS general substrate transporter [Phanerochaete sordida]
MVPSSSRMRSTDVYKLSVVEAEDTEPLLPSEQSSSGLRPARPASMAKGKARRPLRSYIWDTWDKSPEERRFLGKLDACLLTYAALSYFSKYLDQQNVTNAYVSGMKDDLGLHGNELNYITTAWTCGYVIGQIPSNLLLTRIRPSIWIPAMELIWSALTMVLASANSFSTLVAVRFFVGLAESTFYPAIQYVIGSWYKGDELAKRACIFHTASAIGPMFSGFLQTGAYNGLNGVHGLAGWRWLFIIDGIITIPIALLGFLIMPDLPSNTKPSTLYTQEQIDMAQKRMLDAGRKPPAQFTRKKVLGFFKTWHVWLLTPLYVLFNNASGPSTSMIFWLQSFNTPGHQVYTIGQINTYPLGIYAVQVVSTLVWAWWSDAMQLRWPPIIVAGLWHMVVCIVLAATPLYTHIARRWAFYYFTLIQGGLSGLILSWANELTGGDNEKRSFVVATCNTFAYVFQAWLPIVIFPQVEQPRVLKGNIATACIDFGLICVCLAVLFMQKRDERKARTAQANILDVSDGSVEELGDDVDSKIDSKVNISVERIEVR